MNINVKKFESSILEKVDKVVEAYKKGNFDRIVSDEILSIINETIISFQDLLVDNIDFFDYDVDFNNYLFELRRYISSVRFWLVDYMIDSNTPIPSYSK